MTYYYFISFTFSNALTGYVGFGNTELQMNEPFSSYEDITETTKLIKKDYNATDVVILHYQLLRKEEEEEEKEENNNN